MKVIVLAQLSLSLSHGFLMCECVLGEQKGVWCGIHASISRVFLFVEVHIACCSKFWAMPVQATEGDIPLQRLRRYGCLIRLKAFLLEAVCYLRLTSSRYKEARASMSSLLDLHTRFPKTMESLRASTHMLAGEVMPFLRPHRCYCFSVSLRGQRGAR